jgi:Kef-type K+ transport system membrane component KefB
VTPLVFALTLPNLTTAFGIVAVLALAALGGRLARGFGHPAVVGELAVGLLMGPSVFGALAPGWSARIFSPEAVEWIGVLARWATLVFMFLVGLEFDTALLRRHLRGVARIAAFSLVVPFGLGIALAFWLFDGWHGPLPDRTAFVLFVGTAMSITALPVLARILSDCGLLTSTIGTIAIGCAAIDDVVAWSLLGLVAGVAHGQTDVVRTLALEFAYVAGMIVVVRPLLRSAVAVRRGTGGRMAWVVIVTAAAVASAWAAELIGIHAVFGVFLAGACVPRVPGVLEGIEHALRRSSGLLLPAFFVVIGLKTAVTSLNGSGDWLVLLLVIFCATAGKLGASAVAARTTGVSWRDALGIGALLNTRGLVSLVALDIGRSLGILSPGLFTLLVIMAFVTTMATVPLLRALGITSAPGRRATPLV